MDSGKMKLLEDSYEKILNVGFCLIPYEDMSDIIGSNPMVFGTTKDEKILSYEGVEALFKSQIEQMGDMKPSFERTRISLRISNDGNNAFIGEEITLTITSHEEVNTIFMRVSCVMEFLDSQWKLTHWHASSPVETENDHWHMEEWKREKEKLQKLVDQQTADLHLKNRELEIEVSLERIRARAMAMQQSDELADVASVLFEQLRGLGGQLWGTGFGLCKENSDTDEFWFANENGVFPPVSIPNTSDPAHKKMHEGWKNEMKFLALEASSKDLKSHYNYMMTLPEVRPFFQKILDEGLSFPEWQQWNAAYFTHGYLLIITLEPYPNKEILERFARVFDQAYTRFLDLKQAEEQVRESEIQLALERVRARSMAMHHSDELIETSELMFEQIKNLGIELWSCGFSLWYDDDSYFMGYNTGPDGKMGDPLKIPLTEDIFFTTIREAKRRGDDFLVFESDGESLAQTYSYMDTLPVVGEFMRAIVMAGAELPKYQVTHCGFFSQGHLMFITLEPKPEAIDIFKRFTKVFDQTYTRFLDLQKAEIQAHEAKIEAALERVRSRSMAMHKSEELRSVVNTLYGELQNLNVNFHVAGIQLLPDTSKDLHLWISTVDGLYDNIIHWSFIDLPVFHEIYKARTTGELDFTMSESLTEEFFEEYFKLDAVPKERRSAVQHVKIINIAGAYQKLTGIFLMRYTEGFFTPKEKEIIRRFSKAFEQTYTRFLDLKQAEAQVRESEIQLALERVRARSMAMHQSEELADLSLELVKQVHALGIDTWFCAFNIYDDHPDGSLEWGSNGQGTFPQYRTPREGVFLNYYEAGQRGETLLINEISEEKCPSHYDYLCGLPGVGEQLLKMKDTGIPFPSYQIDHAAFFRYGYILFITFEPVPEAHEIFKRFAKVFQQTYTRFLDLKKSEEQAKDALVEAALERVRAQAMAMHHTEDLGKTIEVYFEQLDMLFDSIIVRCGAGLLNKENRNAEMSTASRSADGEIYHVRGVIDMQGHPLLDSTYEHWLKQKEYSYVLRGNEIREYYKYITNQVAVPDNAGTDELHFYFPMFTEGSFYVVTEQELPEDELIVFRRFSSVLSLTYRRFNDLKKAEGQAKEAKIEVALEKVRARTMGMQHSDELADVATVLFKEMNELVHNLWTCGFVLCEKDRQEDEWWLSLEDGFSRGFFLSNVHDYAHATLYEGWLEGEEFRSVQLDGEKLQAHYNWLMEIPVAKNIFDEMESAGMQRPDWQKLHAAYFSKGYLVIITREPCPEEDIFKRFAAVFDQTYTRFLDLKRAEKQAREAQIENALEKVRSRSLAMQSPDELIEVAHLLREEMGSLGVEELETSSIYIHDDNTGLTRCWFTIKNEEDPDKEVSDQMIFNLKDTWVGKQMDKFYRSDNNKTSILMKGNHRMEWIRYCEEKSDLFGTREFYGETVPNRTYHLCKFSNGFLGAASPGNISDESWELMKRATNVFSFAYTRFRDLQIAEASARASARQSSLDRVRADISSMRTAEDLNRITPLIWSELTNLGIPFIRCGVFIIHEEKEQIEVYLSKPDGTSLAVMHLPYTSSDIVMQTVETWRKGDVYTQHWSHEEFVKWGQSMMEQGQVADLKSYQGTEEAPESLYLHFVPFNQGMLYIGSTTPLSDDETDLSTSLAKAFSIAYARYEDFLKLEKAKAGIEEALTELKATQSQLVQQEKLASLGQLTAGIAHEIKNPLNFVNNFSDLSLELLSETKEELSSLSDQLSAEDRKKIDDTHEILHDIEENLKKIHKHGTRADSIVKSMLQHSRGGSGTMAPTDLNALIKEYSNLAFHGMRAGKKPINVTIRQEFDPEIKEVSLIEEDFTRVVLNLFNNAFDAMHETEALRAPVLTVRTHKNEKHISIEIEDNGPGIPEEIKDKILQPFFTTKKGTEGTGLGLSITNDIIKAHGGQLLIRSSKDTGSIFTILLPSDNAP